MGFGMFCRIECAVLSTFFVIYHKRWVKKTGHNGPFLSGLSVKFNSPDDAGMLEYLAFLRLIAK